MHFEDIFKNNKKWIRSKIRKDSEYFSNLAKGQSPELLFIGCSDSRVTAESLMGLEPGQAFVHRNVANLVPNGDVNALTVVNYAVVHLKVKHVVICGHYGCGGVKAAMDADHLGIINPWIKNIRDVYRTHKSRLNRIEDEKKRYNKLVELNVQEQIVNLLKIPEVQQAYNNGDIQIHGWVFDLGTGKLLDLKVKVDKVIEDIYNLYRID